MIKTIQKTETQQQIDAARKILKPTKVHLGEIPRWLSKRVTAYINHNHVDGGYDLPEMRLRIVIEDVAKKAGLKERAKYSYRLDHWGISEGRYHCCPNNCFVSEPYGFCSYAAQIIEALCNALDLEHHVDANSWHYPGHTVRIILHPKSP